MIWNFPKFHFTLEKVAHDLAYKNLLTDTDIDELAQVGYEARPGTMFGIEGLQFLALRPVDKAQKDASRNLDEADENQLPIFSSSSQCQNKPILAFRGTEVSTKEAYKDLVADLHAQQVGENQFAKNRKLIETTLKNLGEKAVVTGHSLGGALAQITASEYPSEVCEVITFQSPGISKRAIQKLEGKKIASTHYQVDGDLVHRAGESLTNGDVVRIELKKASSDPLNAHRAFPLREIQNGRQSAPQFGSLVQFPRHPSTISPLPGIRYPGSIYSQPMMRREPDTEAVLDVNRIPAADIKQSEAIEFARKSPSIALEAAKTAIDPLAHPAEPAGYLNKIIADWFRESYNDEAKRRAVLSSA